MLNLFRKSDPGVNVLDKIWITRQAKWKACSDMLAVNHSCLFVAWFPETVAALSEFLQAGAGQKTVRLFSDITPDAVQNRMLMFVEHYPLGEVEQDFFKMLNLKDVPVLSSMDEPFFERFGGAKTVELMKTLGVGDNEILGHSMITKAIRNAQAKIASKVTFEKKAKSQKEWMELNLPVRK